MLQKNDILNIIDDFDNEDQLLHQSKNTKLLMKN
jgi:hypothetical protein